jgi:hypothetical protein
MSILKLTTIARNFGIIIVFILVFMTAYLVAAEKVSFEHSKGEVLIYRRGHPPPSKAKSSEDEESQAATTRGINTPTTLVDADESSSSPNIQQQTAIFHWKDVCYNISIKGKNRVILDHVDGWVKPGTLTALMVSLPCDQCMYYLTLRQGSKRCWQDLSTEHFSGSKRGGRCKGGYFCKRPKST